MGKTQSSKTRANWRIGPDKRWGPAGHNASAGQTFGDQIGARMEPVIYDGAGKVFSDADADIWDIAFLAVDSMRAEKISLTQPYITIEATYAVRKTGAIKRIEDAGRDGITVLTSVGSAYDMYPAANLKHAKHDRVGTPPESFVAFKKGRGDVVAGVRASLEGFFQNDPTIAILPGVLTKVEQAMALPGAANPQIDALDAFVAHAIAGGFVAAETA